MNVMEAITKRKSIRNYLPQKKIPREDLVSCLEAARLAPSACNGQPWHFIVVDEPDLVRRISGEIFSGIYNMNRFAADASALVVAVSERPAFLSAVGGQVRNTKYDWIDRGIACEHLVLRATELGIGSCWIGWFDEKPLKKILKIPQAKKVDLLISLGYFNGTDPGVRSRKTLEEISSFNAYRRERSR